MSLSAMTRGVLLMGLVACSAASPSTHTETSHEEPDGNAPSGPMVVDAADEDPPLLEGGGSAAEGGAGHLQGSLPTGDKVDLLLMIDNSSSMADKQEFLAAAVPDLINELVSPPCVDGMSKPVSKVAGQCPAGTHFLVEPVRDLHIGLISSSLGAYGASLCTSDEQDDRGHLLLRGGTLRTPQPRDAGAADSGAPIHDADAGRSPDGGSSSTVRVDAGGASADAGGSTTEPVILPFLSWSPGGDPTVLTEWSNRVQAVGQLGCGYEASLESIYRFLIDPDPYDHLTASGNTTVPQMSPEGTDSVVLEQRAQFLRSDSLVELILISDENDCSLQPGGQNQVVFSYDGAQALYPRGTSVCAQKPEDPCCMSCVETRAGCPDPKNDSECQKPARTTQEQPANLACWHQKQRFGRDLLHPVQRYVDGFKQARIPDRSGMMRDNPLFTCEGRGCSPRDPKGVYFTAIVGVPWQDLVRDPKDPSSDFLSPKELANAGRWSVILGDEKNGILPTDPLMIESIDPRTGVHPLTGQALAPPSSAHDANAINGHESDRSHITPPNSDLQYACIFPVSARMCSSAVSCDCSDGLTGQSPLCQDPATNLYGDTQYAAKAYPGLRQLEVVRALGDQGIAMSICPSNTTTPSDPRFGYRPILRHIVRQSKQPDVH